MQVHWSPSLNEALSSFLTDRKAKHCTPRTLEHYQTRLGGFLRFLATQEVQTLSNLTAHHIRLYYIHLQDKELSSHTVHTCARAIRAFLNFCVTEELLDVSPMRKVALPKRDKLLPDYLTAEEVTGLLDACETAREKAAIMILLDTGLRASEFCALNGGHVDHITGAVTVKRGKGNQDRMVFLGNRSRKQLLRYYRQHGKPGPAEPLFMGERSGERITRFGLRLLVARAGERANVEVTPHKLRRTFATWAWKSGIDLKALQGLMGHSDLSTLPSYLGIDAEDLQRAHNQHGPVDHLL